VPGAPRVLAAVFLLIAGPQRDPVAAAPARPAPPPGPAAPAPVAAPGRPAPSVRATAAATPAAEPTYYEAIDVDVVNVEVFVADRHGNPILGLRPQDFTVLEDGKPVTITNFFSAVAAGADRDSPPPAAEPPAGEGSRPAPAAAATAARGPDLPRPAAAPPSTTPSTSRRSGCRAAPAARWSSCSPTASSTACCPCRECGRPPAAATRRSIGSSCRPTKGTTCVLGLGVDERPYLIYLQAFTG
jgi:hypothetical protein